MPCSICLDEYSSQEKRRPKLLPCGHDLCESCIDHLFRQSQRAYIKCPCCVVQHRVKPSSLHVVYGLMSNSQPSVIPKSGLCHFQGCSDSGASHHCAHCNKWFCGAHHSVHYREVVGICRKLLHEGRQRLCEQEARVSRLEAVSSECGASLQVCLAELADLAQKLQVTQKTLQRKLQDSDDVSAGVRSLQLKNEELKSTLEALAGDVEASADISRLWVKGEAVRSFQTPVEPALSFSKVAFDWSSFHDKFNSLFQQVAPSPVTLSWELRLKDPPGCVVPLPAVTCWDVTCVQDTRGCSFASGGPLPSPALVLLMQADSGRLCVADQRGVVKGGIEVEVAGANFQQLCAWGREILLTDGGCLCLRRLSLRGDVLGTSQPGVFSHLLFGLCVLPSGSAAVCDSGRNQVVVLSLPDLDVLLTVTHDVLTNPSYVTATSLHLVVVNCGPQEPLHFFSLHSDFSLAATSQLKFDFTSKLLCHRGSLFLSSKRSVMQLTEDGSLCACVRGPEDAGSDLDLPRGFTVMTSSAGIPTLVVANLDNAKLSFYPLYH